MVKQTIANFQTTYSTQIAQRSVVQADSTVESVPVNRAKKLQTPPQCENVVLAETVNAPAVTTTVDD